VKSKQPVGARARDLYTSALFRGRRAYVERTCDRWFVLSAAHGLLDPDQMIEPYDVALKDALPSARSEWAAEVLRSIDETVGDLGEHVFEVHAGSAYRDHGLVEGLRGRGAGVEIPTEGLNQGRQLAFYARANAVEPSSAEAADGPGAFLLSRAVPDPTTDERQAPGYAVDGLHALGPFEYRWPSGTVECFSRGWECTVRRGTRQLRVRHGIGARPCYGRDRVHTVTWVDGNPIVEGAETEDYPRTRALVSVLKRTDRKDARNLDEVPAGYRRFEIVRHRNEIVGPNARRGLAVKIREDDIEAWTVYALLRMTDRTTVSEGSTTSPRAAGPDSAADGGGCGDGEVDDGDDGGVGSYRRWPRAGQSGPATASRAAVVRALLDHGRTLAGLGSGNFTPDADADRFVQVDAFAFVVAVVCDEQVRFEKAWEAPLELRRRLGHWDLARIVSEPDRVREAFARRPALHRWVNKTAERVSAAARRVLHDYGGDAALIWSDTPTAATLRRRFEAFDGIGQKKSAMAVEILERGLGVPVSALDGSDVAVDIHVRRVFLRAGLAERDDVAHMIEIARALHPERPGELDNPAWDIGRQWCHATSPDCHRCPLESACPKLVDRAAGVRGA